MKALKIVSRTIISILMTAYFLGVFIPSVALWMMLTPTLIAPAKDEDPLPIKETVMQEFQKELDLFLEREPQEVLTVSLSENRVSHVVHELLAGQLIDNEVVNYKDSWFEVEDDVINLTAVVDVKIPDYFIFKTEKIFKTSLRVKFAVLETDEHEIVLEIMNLRVGKLTLNIAVHNDTVYGWINSLLSANKIDLEALVKKHVPFASYSHKTRLIKINQELLIESLLSETIEPEVKMIIDLAFNNNLIDLHVAGGKLGVDFSANVFENILPQYELSHQYKDVLAMKEEIGSHLLLSILSIKPSQPEIVVPIPIDVINRIIDFKMSKNMVVNFPINGIEYIVEVSTPYLASKKDVLTTKLVMNLRRKDKPGSGFEISLQLDSLISFNEATGELLIDFSQALVGNMLLNEENISLILKTLSQFTGYGEKGVVIAGFADIFANPNLSITNVKIDHDTVSLIAKTNKSEIFEQINNALLIIKNNEELLQEINSKLPSLDEYFLAIDQSNVEGAALEMEKMTNDFDKMTVAEKEVFMNDLKSTLSNNGIDVGMIFG